MFSHACMVHAMWGLVIVAAVLGGCGRFGFDASAPGADAHTVSPVQGDSAVPASGDAARSPTDGATATGTGSGTISGTAPDGMPFTTLIVGYVIGHPQYIGETSIFMFSNPIKCSDIGYPGWGQYITAGTQTMELDLPTQSVASYPVNGTEQPSIPYSYGRYRYGEGNGGEVSGGGSSGQIQLTSVGTNAMSGAFDVTFPVTGHLTGTFTAVPCPTGWHPMFP